MFCRPEAKSGSDDIEPEDIKADDRNPCNQGPSEKQQCDEKQCDDRGPCNPRLSEKQWTLHPYWRGTASPRSAMQNILKDAECRLREVFDAREAELLNEIGSLQRENHHLQTLLDTALLPRADGVMSRHRRVQEAEMAAQGCLTGLVADIGWGVGAAQQMCHGLPERPRLGLGGDPIQEEDGRACRAAVGPQIDAISSRAIADHGAEWGQQPDARPSFATPDFGGRSRMTSLGDSSPSDDDDAFHHFHFPLGPRAGGPLHDGGLWHARRGLQCGIQLGAPPGSVQRDGIKEPRHSMDETAPKTTMGDAVLASLERDCRPSSAIVGI